MDIKAQRAAYLAQAQNIVNSAKAASRDLTASEQRTLEANFARVQRIDVELEEARKSQELIASLAGPAQIDPHPVDRTTLGKAPSGSEWARKTADAIRTAAVAQGQSKSSMIPTGSIAGEPIVDVIERPNSEPTTLLDLIGRVRTNAPGGEFTYLRQTGFTNSAAVVAPGALKPVSTATFTEARTKAVVVAHVSEPIPNSWFEDFGAVVKVLEHQMRVGLLQMTEALVLNGDAASGVQGILTTSGLRTQAFATDILTTLRTARLGLEVEGITPTAVVMNPSTIAQLDLLREGTGATAGGFLLSDSVLKDRILGGAKVIASNRIQQGKALIGDFKTVDLIVRDPMSSVAFQQHADFAQRNQTLIRVEHRVGVSITWPAALMLVSLA